MKAKEVIEILRISRSTLRKLRKGGVLKAKRLPNGHYDFDPESVYRYLLEKSGKPAERKTVIYARVSTPKQKQDLVNQTEVAKNLGILQVL
jgi:predicted site-specific integrase-resolvase